MTLEENCAALPQRRKYSKSSAEKIELGEESDGRTKEIFDYYSSHVLELTRMVGNATCDKRFQQLGNKVGRV